jgi:hypothetical protein
LIWHVAYSIPYIDILLQGLSIQLVALHRVEWIGKVNKDYAELLLLSGVFRSSFNGPVQRLHLEQLNSAMFACQGHRIA